MTQPGQTIGPYVIDSLLAEGGMGAVYRARNRVTGQHRALKIVREELTKKGDFVERFVREASIASQVRHPHLVETLEPGIDGDTIYLPMELLEGETLHARIRRLKRIDSAAMAAVLGPVSEAVQALHDRGLVHRDLKPMNVFLHQTARGEIPKVLDFGTARELEDDEHTKTGMVVGSPYYMAPEQAEGRRDINGAADQYALAVMAYQMVTGVRPYESDDNRSALAKLLRGDPYIPPRRAFAGVPESVELVIIRALDRERENRYPRIADFGAALVAAAGAASEAVAVGAGPVISLGPDPISGVSGVRPTLEPTLGPSPTTSSLGFVPTPEATPAPAPAGRKAALAVGALAIIGVVAAATTWSLTRSPDITVTPIPSRAAPATTAPTGAPGGALPAIVPPTALPEAGAEALDSAHTTAGAASTDETTTTGTATPTGTAITPTSETSSEANSGSATPPSGTGSAGTRTGGRRTGGGTRRGGGGAGSSGTGSGGGSSGDTEPCGAATGIPCLD